MVNCFPGDLCFLETFDLIVVSSSLVVNQLLSAKGLEFIILCLYLWLFNT